MARITFPTTSSATIAAAPQRRANAIPIGKMWAKSRELGQRTADEEVERLVQEYLRERQQKKEREEQGLRRRSNTPRRIKLVINRRCSGSRSASSSRGSSPCSSSQGSP